MKKIPKIQFLLFLLAVLLQPAYSSSLKEKAAERVKQNFPKSSIVFQTQTLPPQHKTWEKKAGQTFFRTKLYRWNVFRNDSLQAIAFVDNVMGKEQPITFLVLFSTDGKVIHCEILKYRESIGGAVANPHWQSQFVGKNYKSGFKLNQDIDGISGATISSESLSRGMMKLCFLASFILEKKHEP